MAERKIFVEMTEDEYQQWIHRNTKPPIEKDEIISRYDLYTAIDRIFGSMDKFLDIVEEDTPIGYNAMRVEDDYFLIDNRAHRYISWYKHVGRDFNTDMCSKDEIISFLERLHENWQKEYEEEGKVK